MYQTRYVDKKYCVGMGKNRKRGRHPTLQEVTGLMSAVVPCRTMLCANKCARNKAHLHAGGGTVITHIYHGHFGRIKLHSECTRAPCNDITIVQLWHRSLTDCNCQCTGRPIVACNFRRSILFAAQPALSAGASCIGMRIAQQQLKGERI